MQSIDVFSVRNNAPRAMKKKNFLHTKQPTSMMHARCRFPYVCMCLSMCLCVSHVWNLLNLVEARILFFYTKALFFGLCVYLVCECISVCLFQLLSSCWIIHIKQYAMAWLGSWALSYPSSAKCTLLFLSTSRVDYKCIHISSFLKQPQPRPLSGPLKNKRKRKNSTKIFYRF